MCDWVPLRANHAIHSQFLVILPIAEYEALLSRTSEDETTCLLLEPNENALLQLIESIR